MSTSLQISMRADKYTIYQILMYTFIRQRQRNISAVIRLVPKKEKKNASKELI